MVAPAPILHRYRGTALTQQGRRVVELLGERPQWPTPLFARSELPRGPVSYHLASHHT